MLSSKFDVFEDFMLEIENVRDTVLLGGELERESFLCK
jgi:hypothetical protein